jgi:hypothetical protein
MAVGARIPTANAFRPPAAGIQATGQRPTGEFAENSE